MSSGSRSAEAWLVARERAYAVMKGAARCRALVADPPWRFGDQLPGPGRGAGKQYKGGDLSTAEICTYPLPPLARDAWLFLWRVSAMPLEPLAVCKAWGFEPYAEIVWRKTVKDGSRPKMGMGHAVRNCHEVCIIGKRGNPKVQRLDALSMFDAPLPPKSNGKGVLHSAKPEAFFDLVESLVRGPYVELFARRHRKGWTCIGDEVNP